MPRRERLDPGRRVHVRRARQLPSGEWRCAVLIGNYGVRGRAPGDLHPGQLGDRVSRPRLRLPSDALWVERPHPLARVPAVYWEVAAQASPLLLSAR